MIQFKNNTTPVHNDSIRQLLAVTLRRARNIAGKPRFLRRILLNNNIMKRLAGRLISRKKGDCKIGEANVFLYHWKCSAECGTVLQCPSYYHPDDKEEFPQDEGLVRKEPFHGNIKKTPTPEQILRDYGRIDIGTVKIKKIHRRTRDLTEKELAALKPKPKSTENELSVLKTKPEMPDKSRQLLSKKERMKIRLAEAGLPETADASTSEVTQNLTEDKLVVLMPSPKSPERSRQILSKKERMQIRLAEAGTPETSDPSTSEEPQNQREKELSVLILTPKSAERRRQCLSKPERMNIRQYGAGLPDAVERSTSEVKRLLRKRPLKADIPNKGPSEPLAKRSRRK